LKKFAIPTVLLVLAMLGPRYIEAQDPAANALNTERLVQSIPLRPSHALTGSQFASYVLNMDSGQREQMIHDELLNGNLPNFLRKLVPIILRQELAGGKLHTATDGR